MSATWSLRRVSKGKGRRGKDALPRDLQNLQSSCREGAPWLRLRCQDLAEGTYGNVFCLWKGPAFASPQLFSEVCPGKSPSRPRQTRLDIATHRAGHGLGSAQEQPVRVGALGGTCC